jgi:excisionase family DNA binding protein
MSRKQGKVSTSPEKTVLPITFAEPYLTKEQLAARLQLPASTIYELTRRRCENRIPHNKVGRRLRFNWNQVQAWLEQTTRGGIAA